MRVVLDTNVLISALLSESGPPFLIIEAWLGGRFQLVTGTAQIAEFKRATHYHKLAPYLHRGAVGRLVNGLKSAEIVLRRLPRAEGSPDPADNFLLAMAIAGAADYLVSGDAPGLLALRRIGSTRIVSARRFARLIG